ncbi:MAG: ATP-binding protein [Chlamydiae bacterium]|nr:ATP-binding protein [Chlamydiota bacterium]
MNHFILATFERLINHVPLSHTRYLYESFNISDRLTGLIGPRGAGKTTLLLQYIKQKLLKAKDVPFYFSADLVYFQQTSLLEFVNHLHTVEGYKTLFIDEIHKYQGWNQELKNIYDAFPSLKIIFSGSSMLDLVEGSYDLSRRAKLYHLHGLSFREFINFFYGLNLQPLSLDTLLHHTSDALRSLQSVERLLPLFEDYLKQGYYPFAFESPDSYYEKLSRVIDKTIFEDIANYYNLKTSGLQHFKKLLTYLASIPPGELNIHNLSKHLRIDHKTVEHYLQILLSVALIRTLHPYESGSAALRKPHKLLLNNTNILHTLGQYLGHAPSKGMEREVFFVQSLQNAGIDVFYSKQGDYRTRDSLFEIGGKNKTRSQLQQADLPSYLVKDDILHPLSGEIPLFLFGFLY